jgi:co-chaperonin GroES (HSP10)
MIPQTLNSYVLLGEETGATQVDSGLVVGEVKGDRTESWMIKGRVVSVPKSVVQVKVGDLIHVAKWEVHHAMVGGIHYIAVLEKDIILKEENGAKRG